MALTAHVNKINKQKFFLGPYVAVFIFLLILLANGGSARQEHIPCIADSHAHRDTHTHHEDTYIKNRSNTTISQEMMRENYGAFVQFSEPVYTHCIDVLSSVLATVCMIYIYMIQKACTHTNTRSHSRSFRLFLAQLIVSGQMADTSISYTGTENFLALSHR